MFRPTLMAAALAVAFPAYADADLDALRAELKEMKTAYEARIQALEARLAGVEAPARNAVQADEPPTTAASAAAFNPEISLILQGSYAHRQDLPARRITGFLPNGTPEGATHGFSASESELVVAANVDPYFRGYFNAVLNDDTIGVEEAWFQTLALGEGLTVKGGRFRSGIGYQNEQHPHAWDFATNNLMYEALFGEGYGNDGLQLKWVAPTELYTELGAEIGRGANFPGTDRNENGAGSYALFGHLGGDVGISNSWRAGLSYLHARARDRASELGDINDVPAATLFSGNSTTWLADFVWKWAPDGNAVARNFKFAAEYFRSEESGQLQCVDLDLPADPSLCGVDPGSTGDYAATQSGFYAQGVYQFMPRWRSGYRYDRLNPGSVDLGANNALLPVTDYKPTRHSLMLDYSPSEFSRLRLQYSKNKSMEGVSENQWFVQYIHSLGAHGAHKF